MNPYPEPLKTILKPIFGDDDNIPGDVKMEIDWVSFLIISGIILFAVIMALILS